MSGAKQATRNHVFRTEHSEHSVIADLVRALVEGLIAREALKGFARQTGPGWGADDVAIYQDGNVSVLWRSAMRCQRDGVSARFSDSLFSDLLEPPSPTYDVASALAVIYGVWVESAWAILDGLHLEAGAVAWGPVTREDVLHALRVLPLGYSWRIEIEQPGGRQLIVEPG